MIARGKYATWTMQAKYWLMTWVNLLDCLVVLASLGFLHADMHARILFSGWMDED